jgi:hypothetical protein
LLKLIVVAVAVGALGWFAKQSVRVETSDREVQITIDRHALREAGARFKRQSKNAVSKVGQALEDAGGETEAEPSKPPAVIERIFSR